MSTTKIPNELLSSGVGTGASNLVELDSSGKLPAVDGSAVTSLSSANLTGALPVLDGSNLTGLTPTPTKASIDALGISASSITGALPAIDGSNLTGIETDLTSIRNDIATLALHSAVADNRAAYNLPNSFIDQFEDDTGIGTETDTDRNTNEYISSVSNSWGAETQQTLSTTYMAGVGGVSIDANAIFDGNSGFGYGGYAFYIGSPSGYAKGFQYNIGSHFGVNFKFTKMRWANVATTARFTNWKIETTQDGSTWTQDGSIAVAPNTDSWNTHTLATDFTVTNTSAAWRITFDGMQETTWGSNAGCGEIEMWGKAHTLATNATGTLISTAQTSNAAQTKVSGVVLYKNNAGTATLGTDLKIYFTCNGGTNWTESTPVAAGTFSSGILMAKCPEVTCTSGTDIRYKAVWANQASGSKETQLHGIGMNY